MESYLIISDAWRQMEEQPQIICQQFERFLNCDARCLAPVLFAEYSCLTQFVHEEIDLVVSNQQKQSDARLTQEQFIKFWGWQDKLATKVYHLSGGWRKLLGISLFLNRKSNCLFFIDFASHLSDRMISFTLERMEQLQVRQAGFVEYDGAILQAHLKGAKRLKQSETRLLEIS